MGTQTVRKMAEKFELLEQQLEMFIDNTRQLGIIVGDFQPQGQNVLNQKIHTMVTGMQEIDKLKGQVHDVQIPLEVFEYIDRGKHPGLYTKDCMEKALAKNDAVKKFKVALILELSKEFPNEMNKYRAIRGDER